MDNKFKAIVINQLGEQFSRGIKILDKNLVHYDELGIVTTKDMIIDDKSKVSIDELISSNNNWLTSYMN